MKDSRAAENLSGRRQDLVLGRRTACVDAPESAQISQFDWEEHPFTVSRQDTFPLPMKGEIAEAREPHRHCNCFAPPAHLFLTPALDSET